MEVPPSKITPAALELEYNCFKHRGDRDRAQSGPVPRAPEGPSRDRPPELPTGSRLDPEDPETAQYKEFPILDTLRRARWILFCTNRAPFTKESQDAERQRSRSTEKDPSNGITAQESNSLLTKTSKEVKSIFQIHRSEGE
eukprot:gene17078-5277_t